MLGKKIKNIGNIIERTPRLINYFGSPPMLAKPDQWRHFMTIFRGAISILK